MSGVGGQWRASRLERAATLRRLGLRNVLRVGLYRLAARTGVWRLLTRGGEGWSEQVFGAHPAASVPPSISDEARVRLLVEADEIRSGLLRFYSGEPVPVGGPPEWHVSPCDGSNPADPAVHWSRVRSGGDIKDIWEASRFTWAPVLARAWRVSGEPCYLETLERWVRSWTSSNPVNLGANWACGQETSIRLLHLVIANDMVGIAEPTAGLQRFVREHVKRIAATTAYAVGQDNNHGTSEAVGLYVGGLWLVSSGIADGERYHARGRAMLEERVRRLVMPDGSFSQYSVNYHRLLLDTLCVAEWWRARAGDEPFSKVLYERAQAATRWLYENTDPATGDTPNIGANDGARLLVLASGPYRDCRPSVQLASALFLQRRAYDDAEADEPLLWLGLEPAGEAMSARASTSFVDGGWVTMHASDARSWACVKHPAYRFRPSHADALHVDLWRDGVNVLRDGGAFGYAAGEPWARYFPGTASHNTIEFDGRDQMPRIGRFLFGGWLKGETSGLLVSGSSAAWSGSYVDRLGSRHARTVQTEGGEWVVTDTIGGGHRSAVLRWRLAPGEYAVTGNSCAGESLQLEVEGYGVVGIELVEGWESRLYHVRTPLPVLEVTLEPACTVTTRISFNESSH